MPTKSKNPKVTVEASLIRHDEDTVVVYIGDAPIEVRSARMPRTFEKLAARIEKANPTS